MSKGCYQCGSEEGSEVVLCPKCRQERRQRSEAINEVRRPGEEEEAPEEEDPPQFQLDRKAAVALAWGVIIVGFIGYRLLASGGQLSPDAVYDRCMEKFAGAEEKVKEDMAAASAADPAAQLSQNIAQMLSGMVGDMTEATCKALKEECEKDIESKTCTEFWEALQK